MYQNMFYNSGEVISDQLNFLFFFLETGVPKRAGGEGGGVRHLGKIPKIFPVFFLLCFF